MSVTDVMAAATSQLSPGQAVYVVVGNAAEAMSAGVREGGASPTLRDALAELAARGDVGGGGLIELDSDGRPTAIG